MNAALLTAFRCIGLTLGLVLQLSWVLQPVPTALKLLPASLLLLTAIRPAAGLIVIAGLGPMANAIALWAQSPLPGIRLFEQLVLAFVTGTGLHWWRRLLDLRLAGPATLAAASSLASLVAIQPLLLLQRQPDASAADHLRALFERGDYFVRSSTWDPLFFAALTIEGLALAVATELIVRRDASVASAAVRMAVVGQAAVAALNVQQVIGAAIRSGDGWRELVRIFREVRVSLFHDLNAAASTFLLYLFAGVGLLTGGAAARLLVGVLLALIGIGLWLAGSRIALAALVLTCLGMLALAVLRGRGASRRTAIAGMAAVAALVAVAVMAYPSARSLSLGPTVATRRIMAETSFNMWRTAPIFGIGVGRYYEESSRFGAQALVTEVRFYPNENAHNYFLQMLSTEGIVGLTALLLVLGAVIVPALRVERTQFQPLRRWTLAGIVACLITWLTGHPQLVPEAAFGFWLLFGVLAGLTPAPIHRGWRTALTVAAVLLIATAPFRARQAIGGADFEHIGVGLSQWQPEIDGVRYRFAPAAFGLYLPADGRSVELPLRRAPETPDPLIVTIAADGRTVYEPLVTGEGWQTVRIQLPKSNRRFAKVDFVVKSLDGRELPGSVLYVGKTAPR